MPFGLGGGGGGGGGSYKDLERAPLSALDDDDDVDDGMMSLPPYSDNPVTPPATNGNNGKAGGNNKGRVIAKKNGRYRDDPAGGEEDCGRGKGGGRRKGSSRAIAIVDDDDDDAGGGGGGRGSGARARSSGYDDDEYDDEGYGEGDFFRGVNTPSKGRRRPPPTRRHRGGLACAYLKYWSACGCCPGDYCCSDPNSASRNIGGGGEMGGGGKCARRALMALVYLFLLMVILLCAASIGYIIAQDGSPFDTDVVAPSSSSSSSSSASSSSGAVGNDDDDDAGIIPPPIANLREICTDWITECGRKKCGEECDKASCCSLPSTDANSCWTGQASVCAEYRVACMGMELNVGTYDSTGTGEGPSALPSRVDLDTPWELDRTCSIDNLKTQDGFNDCFNACLKSQCCYPNMFDCEVNDYSYCDEYASSCATVALSWRGTGHAIASSGSTKNITTVANAVMLECNSANLNPPDSCIEACKPGGCCYVSDTYPPIEQLFREHFGDDSPMSYVDSCSSNVGFCQQYGSCEHLNHLKDAEGWNTADVTYELDISSVCKAEYIAQFGALECSNVCQPAHCCFSSEYKCDEVQLGHLACGDYKQCGVLYPSQESTGELFELAKAIDEVCSEDSLSLVSGRKMCQKLCKDSLCCFDNGAYGCANDPSKNCLAHAGCETLVSTSSGYDEEEEIQPDSTDTGVAKKSDGVEAEVDAFLAALESACSETSLKTLDGIQQCHNRCQTHLCCFTSDPALAGNDCSNIHVEACSAYQACERLVTPTDQDTLTSTAATDLDEIANAIEKACVLPDDPYLIDQSWVEGCHSLCASRLCCLVDEKIESNCRATLGAKECNAYSACDILINDSGQEVTGALQIEDKFGDLNDVCTIAVVQDSSLHAACEERCRDRSCCFESTQAFSCYDMEKEWCGEFKACECVDMFFFSNDKLPNTEDSIVQTSNADNAQTSEPDDMNLIDESTVPTINSESATSISDNAESAVETVDIDEGPTENKQLSTAPTIDSVSATSISDNAESAVETVAIDDDPTLDEFKVGIEADCSPESLNTLEGIEQCYNKCAAHLCCVSAEGLGSDFDCSNAYPDECKVYQVCEQLVSRHSTWRPPSTSFDPYAVKKVVNDACIPPDNAPVTKEWVSNCHMVCEARMCCLAHSSLGSSCIDVLGEGVCNDFSACQNLIGGELRDAVSINDLCNNDVTSNKELFLECREKCTQRPCCFEYNPTSSCYEMEEEWCNEYESCNLVGFAFLRSSITNAEVVVSTNVATAAINELEEFKSVCNAHTLQQNWDTCKVLCSQYVCCFRSEFSCYEIHELECDDHYICEELYAKDGSAESNTAPTIDSVSTATTLATAAIKESVDQIESQCSKAYILTFGPEDCKLLCEEVKCCFDFAQCMYANEDDCSSVNACYNVYNSD